MNPDTDDAPTGGVPTDSEDRPDRGDWCPVAATARLLDRKWHPVVVDRLLKHGPLGFNALKRAVDGVSSKVLSNSLDDMRAKGLVTREVVSDSPFRVEYALTDRGRSLEPVVGAMREWGRTRLVPAASPETAVA